MHTIDAFCRAIGRQATAKGWRTRHDPAPKTVWNFDHDQRAPAQLILFAEDPKKKHAF